MAAAASSGVVIKTLLVTDLVDSTKLVEKLGDARAASVSDRHDRLARELLGKHGGREIDKTDGFLFLFERPLDATLYALDYHRALDTLAKELSVPLQARAGIHLGEVILRENPPEQVARGAKPLEVEGIAKPMAARVMSLAMGRQTLMTRAAFDLARRAFVGREARGTDIRWLAHGPYMFKGVEEPVEIGEVGEDSFAPLAAPRDSEKAKRATVDDATLGWRPAQGIEVPHRTGWVLDRKLGEGAFGEVWVARQARSGMLRVYKFCFEADKLRMLRHEVTLFQVLREALGDREDIGRILDWQLEEAPYFLESEYAEGGTLADWAEQAGGLEKIPIAVRVDVVAQVAETLGSAHSLGVLHKDIRPANILVRTDKDGKPRARLIDFGIGQIMDRKLLKDRGVGVHVTDSILVTDGRELLKKALAKELPPTSSGSGAQIYVAPELIESQRATVQADIYSLGVVLFQMAVGSFRRVLAPGWERDVADDLLRQDIAACVDGSPEHRLGSAGTLAERLRTLEKRRAEAAHASAALAESERSRIVQAEQARRRRQLAVVSVVAALFVGTVSVLALQARARAGEAEAARRQAEDLVGFMLTDVADGLRPLQQLRLLYKVADKCRDYYGNTPAVAPAELRNRGLAFQTLGDVQLERGEIDNALRDYGTSLHIAQQLAATDAPPEAQRAVAEVHARLAQALLAKGDGKAAMASARESLSVLEKLQGKDGAPEVALAWLDATLLAGSAASATGAGEEALASFRAALAAGEEIQKRAPGAKRYLAGAHRGIGENLRSRGMLDGALVAYRSSRAILVGLRDAEPGPRWEAELAEAHAGVGSVLEAQGDAAGKADAYRSALVLYEAMAARDPRNAALQEKLARARAGAERPPAPPVAPAGK